MTRGTGGQTRLLAGAAVTAVLLALILTALGWWVRGWEYDPDSSRYLDPAWLLGALTTGLGHLVVGPTGFKIALAGLGALTAAGLWLRGRRNSRRAEGQRTDHEGTGQQNSGQQSIGNAFPDW